MPWEIPNSRTPQNTDCFRANPAQIPTKHSSLHQKLECPIVIHNFITNPINTPMLNYNAIISALRSVARDILRLEKVANIRSDRHKMTVSYDNEISLAEKSVTEAEENITTLKKNLARATFTKSQISDEDPDKEEKMNQASKTAEKITLDIKQAEKNLAIIKLDAENEIENLKAEKAKLETANDLAIQKVQTGETKVCTEDLDSKTQELIKELIPGQLSDVISQAVATPVATEEDTKTSKKSSSK